MATSHLHRTVHRTAPIGRRRQEFGRALPGALTHGADSTSRREGAPGKASRVLERPTLVRPIPPVVNPRSCGRTAPRRGYRPVHRAEDGTRNDTIYCFPDAARPPTNHVTRRMPTRPSPPPPRRPPVAGAVLDQDRHDLAGGVVVEPAMGVLYPARFVALLLLRKTSARCAPPGARSGWGRPGLDRQSLRDMGDRGVLGGAGGHHRQRGGTVSGPVDPAFGDSRRLELGTRTPVTLRRPVPALPRSYRGDPCPAGAGRCPARPPAASSPGVGWGGWGCPAVVTR